MLKRISLVVILAACAMAALLNISAEPAAGLTGTDKIVHLLNRAGYGPRPGDVEKVRQKGVSKYIEEQLRPEGINESALDPRLASFDTLRADPATIWNRYQRDPRPIVEQLQSQKIIRAIYAERQLQEVLTDFWFNHFNVNWSKGGVQAVTTGYERDAIRPHVLGKFKTLLLATARHPAMLVYLDNAMSSAAGINENYARELMELHTLGVDGGYLQKDVEEVARAFTGWTVSRDGSTFEFRKDMHVPGSKVLLEHTIASGGYEEGEAVLDILTHHPGTARFIATKLVRRFVADEPPPALVRRVAQVFTDTDGDIRTMVRTILTSEEFSSPSAIRAKAKSPFEAVVSAMRAIDADLLASIDSQAAQGAMRGLPAGDIVLTKAGGARIRVSPAIIITRVIQDMGQFPYQNPEPTGYPDRSDYWMNSLTVLNRMNFAVSLVNNEVLGTNVDENKLRAMLQGNAESKDAWKTALAAVIEPRRPEAGQVSPASPSVARAFALALGSPDFQQK
jgi:uncharacterized protein (DUF1800 family)